MKSMYGNKYHIIIPVHKLHHLMHPPLVILHAYKTAEYTYSVVDMDYVIPYRERCKVIDSELLALLDSPSYAYTVEPVEYLMVAVAAYLVLMVDESVMYILFRYELRHYASVLRKDRLKPLELRLLFSIYAYPVAFLETLPYVFGKKLEILVEHRLRSDVELYGIFILTGQRKFHIYLAETLHRREEPLVPVHV